MVVFIIDNYSSIKYYNFRYQGLYFRANSFNIFWIYIFTYTYIHACILLIWKCDLVFPLSLGFLKNILGQISAMLTVFFLKTNRVKWTQYIVVITACLFFFVFSRVKLLWNMVNCSFLFCVWKWLKMISLFKRRNMMLYSENTIAWAFKLHTMSIFFFVLQDHPLHSM